MQEIHVIAADIAVDGFQWQRDGWKAFHIIELLDTGFEGGDKASRSEFLVAGLKALDRKHNWDLAGRTQEQEDQLYGMFVSLYLSSK